MTVEEKEILVKELCARMPYGLQVEHTSGFRGTLHNVMVYPLYDQNTEDTIKDYICRVDFFNDDDWVDVEFFKPYLFPLSSMTEKQKEEYYYIVNYLSVDDTDKWREGEFVYVNLPNQFEQLIYFYYKNHLDYRGLINMGIALDATGKNIY